MELPDIVVVTKADMGDVAQRARNEVEGALTLFERDDDWRVPVILASATHGAGGLGELHKALTDHLWLSCLRAGPPAAARRQTASASETPPHARHQNADLFATGDDQRQDRPVREATGDEQKYRSRDRV